MGCSLFQNEDLNKINVQQKGNRGVDKTECHKLAGYRELDLKNIPDISEDTLKDLAANIHRDVYQIEEINIIKKEPIFITKPEDAQKGYLIEASIKLIFQAEKKVIAVVMKKPGDLKDDKEGYELVFKYVKYVYPLISANEAKTAFPKYALIDIDSDGCRELFLETSKEDSFNHEDLAIYRYKDGQFNCIFNQGLRSFYILNYMDDMRELDLNEIPVCFYNNSYKLVKNRENPNKYDLHFSIKTQDGTDIKKAGAVGKFLIPKPVREEVVFSFNGDRYVAEKVFYNYKQDEYKYKSPYCSRKNNEWSLSQKDSAQTDYSQVRFEGLVREAPQEKFIKVDKKNIPDLEEKTLKNLLGNVTVYYDDFETGFEVNLSNVEAINIATAGTLENGYLIEGMVYERLNPANYYNVIAVVKEKNKSPNSAGKYELVFRRWNYAFMRCDLLDIDSDGGHELLIREGHVGKVTSVPYGDVSIFKYKSSEFGSIFQDDLYNYAANSPECYLHSYKFIKNKQNPSCYDLVYYINTQHDWEWCKQMAKAIEEHSGEKIEIPKPSKETVVYSFNGDKYVPNK